MRISFIGSGNVATQLAISLSQQNSVKVVQIISRTISNAKRLADQVHAEYSDQLKDLIPETDLIFIAVRDDMISSVASALPPLRSNQIICHCAGSIPINVLGENGSNQGCFYPLQTISKSRTIDWTKIPVFISGSNPYVKTNLEHLAFLISDRVELIDDTQRMALHVAAVFSCNFTNAMYQMGADICEANHLPFSYLHPLIQETAEKVLHTHPRKAQTGPAIRKDTWIINKHISWLEDRRLKKIYQTISSFIQEN